MNTTFPSQYVSESIAGKKLNLLLCCSGYVTKERMKDLLASLCNLLNQIDELHLRIVVTNRSRSAFDDDTLSDFVEKIYTDEDEWSQWRGRGDPVLHIDLTKWADLLLLAPLDLNTMAKIAIGICDNLLTCTLRAWNLQKPVIFCPCLPVEIRKQRLTQLHITMLQSWGYKELYPDLYESGVCSIKTGNSNSGYLMVDPAEITKMVIHLLATKGII